MTNTLSKVSHKIITSMLTRVLIIFLTSKLITCFIDGFTAKMKFQSIVYLLNESEHMYWILDLEGEVHSIWDLRISGLQKCKSNGFSKVRRDEQKFLVRSKNNSFSLWGVAPTLIYLPHKSS